MRRRVGALAAVMLTACLGPQPDPSQFFLLSPAAVEAPGAQVPVRVGVGPVTLPGYLDRPQLVTRLGTNQIALSENDRWAEPFPDNLTRTLEASLARMLPGSSFVAYPWYATDAPDYAVALVVRQFEADTSGLVVLDATWSLWRDDERIDTRTVRIEEPAAGPDRAASVAAHSRALAEIGRQVAVAVRGAAGR